MGIRLRGAILSIVGMLLGTTHALAQCGLYCDKFGDDAHPHAAEYDYTTGIVQPGGFWTGIHNPTNGGGLVGDPPSPIQASFVADGFDHMGNSKSGKLFIEDLNLHLN